MIARRHIAERHQQGRSIDGLARGVALDYGWDLARARAYVEEAVRSHSAHLEARKRRRR